MIVPVSEKNCKGLSVTVGREINCNALDDLKTPKINFNALNY